jgi:serine/threonine protein phosphatase PrpC
MKFASYKFSGAYKQENEDFAGLHLLEGQQLIAAVADGVGGHVGGHVASRLAVANAIDFLTKNPAGDFSLLFEKICNVIEEEALSSPEFSDMATTLTIVQIKEYKARFAHVGDSRIYHLRNKGIKQITEDQSEVALLIREGILSKQQAEHYGRRSVLYSALSAKRKYALTQGEFDVSLNDRLIMLTDGVYRMVSKSKIRDLSRKADSISILGEEIISEVKNLGPRDDHTLIGFEITPDLSAADK